MNGRETWTIERKHDETFLDLLLIAGKARYTLERSVASLREVGKRLNLFEVTEVLEALKNESARWVHGYDRERLIKRHETAKADWVAARDALDAHEDHYSGWERFWLVTSSDGLIHRSTNCSTCNKGARATTFALLPSISGTTPKTAVEVLGPALCSVCFPDAPVEWIDSVRIPARLARVLYEEGEEAFVAAKAEYERKAEARAVGLCEFTGTVTPEVWSTIVRNYHRYAKCPTCGTVASVTGTGKFRRHKVKGA